MNNSATLTRPEVDEARAVSDSSPEYGRLDSRAQLIVVAQNSKLVLQRLEEISGLLRKECPDCSVLVSLLGPSETRLTEASFRACDLPQMRMDRKKPLAEEPFDLHVAIKDALRSVAQDRIYNTHRVLILFDASQKVERYQTTLDLSAFLPKQGCDDTSLDPLGEDFRMVIGTVDGSLAQMNGALRNYAGVRKLPCNCATIFVGGPELSAKVLWRYKGAFANL